MKRIILVSVLVLFSIGPAVAQSPVLDRQPNPATPSTKAAAIETCEAQLRRLAQLNKTLAASYNPEHVYDECVGEQ